MQKCKKCRYGKHMQWGEYYCDYLTMVGHRRPVKAAECKIYKTEKGDADGQTTIQM